MLLCVLKGGGRRSHGDHPVLAVFAALFCLCALCLPTWAKPTSDQQAKEVVAGWLSLDAAPMGKTLGAQVTKVTPYADDSGQTAYYVVSLSPTGLVIVPADDEVEPIIAFTSGGQYDPSPDNPFGALISTDLPGRIAAVRQSSVKTGGLKSATDAARAKWVWLTGGGKAGSGSEKQGEPVISDVRVPPLIQTAWDQTTAGDVNTYNLHTPNNYPCGCVATAMAQLMRCHRFPTGSVPTNISYAIKICGVPTTKFLRGGYMGAAYDWENMVLSPDSSITERQREAIGALTADAGVSVGMDYCTEGSGADTLEAATAFKSFFSYSNAIKGYNDEGGLPATNRNDMVNPNLDAGLPVLFGIFGNEGGHAIACDGYGYNINSIYHHLNMGWSGYNNVWYNLPNIDSVITYYSINKCVYNIYPSGTGEIISGRVTDKQGNPVNEATVRATRRGGGEYIASTNANGIYALDKIPSSSTYIISVSKAGYAFVDQLASTGVSTDNSTTTGNKWGLNFTGGPPRYTLPDSGQTTCYNSSEKISCPNPGQRYYGQDANYKGVQPSYRNNGDGTVSDLVTGLMWNTDAGRDSIGLML